MYWTVQLSKIKKRNIFYSLRQWFPYYKIYLEDINIVATQLTKKKCARAKKWPKVLIYVAMNQNVRRHMPNTTTKTKIKHKYLCIISSQDIGVAFLRKIIYEKLILTYCLGSSTGAWITRLWLFLMKIRVGLSWTGLWNFRSMTSKLVSRREF